MNTSTRLKTRHAVNEADSNAAMKRGMVSPPTSKSATPKPIRRNVECGTLSASQVKKNPDDKNISRTDQSC